MGLIELGQRVNREVIQMETKRDKQVLVGLSNLGNPCDRCLGLALAGVIPDGPRAPRRDPSQGLSALWGTAMHLLIEERLKELQWPGVMVEKRHLIVGEIEGYGVISGTGDLCSIFDYGVFDWKGSKKAYIAEYQRNGLPIAYRVQRNGYGMGMANLGFKVKEVGNKFIPRDSNSFNDIWDDVEKYNPRMVDEAMKRATRIWKKYVVNGRVERLQSARGCMECNRWKRKVVIVGG